VAYAGACKALYTGSIPVVASSGMSTRSLMLVNVLFRVGYGVGGLLAPSAMARMQMVPDTDERPDARLFVRGFSGHQVAVAAVGLGSLRRRWLRGPAIALAVAIDAMDMVSAVAEARARRRMDADVVGGFLLSATGVATALAARRADG
jgi:hypothetical protein